MRMPACRKCFLAFLSAVLAAVAVLAALLYEGGLAGGRQGGIASGARLVVLVGNNPYGEGLETA